MTCGRVAKLISSSPFNLSRESSSVCQARTNASAFGIKRREAGDSRAKKIDKVRCRSRFAPTKSIAAKRAAVQLVGSASFLQLSFKLLERACSHKIAGLKDSAAIAM